MNKLSFWDATQQQNRAIVESVKTAYESLCGAPADAKSVSAFLVAPNVSVSGPFSDARGFVLAMNGDYSDLSRLVHGDSFASGMSMYQLDDATSDGNSSVTVAYLQARAQDFLKIRTRPGDEDDYDVTGATEPDADRDSWTPHMSKGSKVSIVRFHVSEERKDRFAIVIGGNHGPSAAAAKEWLLHQPRMKVSEFVDSKVNRRCLAISKMNRDALASKTAEAFGLRLKQHAVRPKGEGGPVRYEAYPSIECTSDMFEKFKGVDRVTYAFYNGVYCTAACESGVLEYLGPVAGYHAVHPLEETGRTATKRPPWTNRFLNLFPADTGYVENAHVDPSSIHRFADLRGAQADVVAKEHVWDGPVAGHDALVLKHRPRDAAFIQAENNLGVKPQWEQQTMIPVITRLVGMSPDEVADHNLLDFYHKTDDVLVPMDSPLIHGLVKEYATGRREWGTLAEMLADEVDGRYFRLPKQLTAELLAMVRSLSSS